MYGYLQKGQRKMQATNWGCQNKDSTKNLSYKLYLESVITDNKNECLSE